MADLLRQIWFWLIFCLSSLLDINKHDYDEGGSFCGLNITTQPGLTSKSLSSETLATEFSVQYYVEILRRNLKEFYDRVCCWLGSFRAETTPQTGPSPKSRSFATSPSQLQMKCQAGYKAWSLETMPYEIRMKILRSIPDFSDLMSLVRASPIFLQQYLEVKKSLLAGCLKMSLNTALVDALAVQEATALRGDKSVERDDVRHQLNKYSVRRQGDESIIDGLINKYDEDFLLGIHVFWQTHARPNTAKFARFFLSRFDPQSPPRILTNLSTTNLSTTENTRLLRALYRFELFCCLFGGESRSLQLDFTPEEVLYFFFCLFRPWEVEEIYSVYTVAQDEMTARLRMLEKKHFHAVTHEFAFAGGAASWGLRGFDMAFNDIDCYSMISIQPGNTLASGYGFMENVLCHDVQARRRRLFTTDDDLAEQSGDPLPYVGEAENQPSFGWVLVCKGKHINIYGGSVHKPSPRDWGYVFWDRWRLTKMKGDKKLKSGRWEPGVTY